MAILRKIGLWFLTLTVAAAGLAVTGALLLAVLQMGGSAEGGAIAAVDAAILDRYDMYMTNQISSALDGVLEIEKVYWLSDDDKVAPEPNQAYYGVADSAAELGWLLEEAAELLEGQEGLVHSQAFEPPDPEAVGRIATLRIQVLFREHYSWQGRIVWEEKRKEAVFRSVLELIQILDEILAE